MGVACGVDLVSATDGFDLNGSAADIILAVMAWAAKMERLAINERIAVAQDRVETEGGTWGRQPRLADSEPSDVYTQSWPRIKVGISLGPFGHVMGKTSLAPVLIGTAMMTASAGDGMRAA